MKVKEAIQKADELRPNAVKEAQKAEWLYELEGRVAETVGVECPVNSWPDDAELLMGAPCASIYYLYLCAMIDFSCEDTELYANDSAIFNTAFGEAISYWRRHNKPADSGYWKGIL